MDFFTGPFCRFSIFFVIAWFFFIFVSSLIIILLIQYPMDENSNSSVIKLIFGTASVFALATVARCCCIRDYDYIEIDDSRQNNFLDYKSIS